MFTPSWLAYPSPCAVIYSYEEVAEVLVISVVTGRRGRGQKEETRRKKRRRKE